MVIDVQGINHRFGSFQVLTDVWFRVPRGEIFGFIGPNGAGKTTTLRMMATLLEPDDGRILVDGVDVVEAPADVRRRLGFMPDSFGVYERITVQEYLDFFAAAHGIALDARTRTVDAVMELTDLGDLRERLVAQMSKGMKQRLAIARTLLHDPSVLILDEPANGLDPRARIEMRDLIEELQRLGKTVVLSSHILTELSDMCTSVAILEKGRLLAAGTVDQISRTLQPDRAVRLRVLAPPDEVQGVFEKIDGVIEVERQPDGDWRIAYQGGEQLVAEVVAAAVAAELGVVRVEPDVDDLERIFLEVTRGELQ